MKLDSFRLLSRSSVSRLLDSGPQLREFVDRYLAPGGPVRRFPSGAIEIDDSRIGDEADRAIRACIAPGCGLQASTVFQSLGPFALRRYYYIYYPLAYQQKLRTEHRFSVGQGTIRPPAPGEFGLAQLEVTVGFRTRLGKAVRRAFVEAISAWATAAGERGAFDDGPVSLASQGLEVGGTRARFLLDAGLSGQDTLNWLALAILDFGEDVHTVTGIAFGSSADFLDAKFGPFRGEKALIDFPSGRSIGDSRRTVGPHPVSFVPPEATPYGGCESRKFALLALQINEWDSLVVTIYFGGPIVEEREQLKGLIDAWLLLGSYGGLGGVGTHSADEVRFDEATDSAIIRADMGDADPGIALSVLIRALEGFESTGPPIDAVVLGRAAWAGSERP